MDLSTIKSFDTGAHEYDQAHREASRNEQERPCTCQIKARTRSGGATYPSLITAADADPDCELHFPWKIEDERERVCAMRWWFAGYQVGMNTARAHVDAATLTNVLWWVLDESNDAPDPNWLEDRTGVTPDALRDALETL